MTDVVVIGGGVAGLTVAYEILERWPDCELRVLEANELPGGNIRTDQADGFTVEWGPNGFLDNVPETLDLVNRLGITDRLLPSNLDSKRRFIYRAGKLNEVKANPLAFLASEILSLPGRLRILLEPFTPRPSAGDQSVFEFARRHIGKEAASILVDAMVSGVCSPVTRAN